MLKKSLIFLLSPLLLFAQPVQNNDLFNKDDAAFLINGEFLYWTVNEGGLDFAIRMKTPSWGPSDSYAQGDMERAEFSWDPGYRFSLGYYRAPNFWEADFQWTYIHVGGKNHHSRPPAEEGRFMTGTWPQIFTNPIQKATSTIHLYYQMIDLIVNRVFHPFDNPHLRLRLTGGLTGVWLNQGWKVRYFDNQHNQTLVNNMWRYWGFGFKAGLGFDWFWGNDFYVTGRAITGLVSGHYHNHGKQETNTIQQTGDSSSIPVRDLRYKDYRVAFTSQLSLGPSYQKSFPDWRMELFIGYEMTIWTNLHEVYRSSSSSASDSKETWINSSMIALQGLSARGTFNF
ncbi:MAG: hypothetical protein KFB93_06660 [Simkaniaceae bacterium]|jgi:hypothetical protein|nr:MAG: hypothetical protein KFB93_06660 [Simkaniaceae bacterium]